MCFRGMESCVANMQHSDFTGGHWNAVGPTGLRGQGPGGKKKLSNLWEGVWNAMQAWQWFGAALQPWSRGENQRAWVEWYVLTHGIVA